jgi:signal transduction histidine kinase/ActR/RegA family two-component response regulator
MDLVPEEQDERRAQAFLDACSPLLLGAGLYFAAMLGYAYTRLPDPYRFSLMTQKVAYLGVLLVLYWGLMKNKLRGRDAHVVVFAVTNLCLTSMAFSGSLGIVENLTENITILFIGSSLIFLSLARSIVQWALLWAVWLSFAYLHFNPEQRLQEGIVLIGFQLVGFTIQRVRVIANERFYGMREREVAQSQALEEALQRAEQANDKLDQLVEERTAQLRLAYEELRLSAQQREEMQRASEQLQDQLLQAQKMESLGRLAGGVAHDFNNLLTVILGNLELAQNMTPDDPDFKDYLHQSEVAARRAAEVSAQLLAFSRKQVLKVRDLDLAKVVEASVRLVQRLIGEDVLLEVDYGPGGLLVKGDHAQLQQVIMNLSVNARDAMPSGGRLEFKLFHSTLHGQRYASLSVTDNGEGIDPEVQPRIFEPFFTSKPFGKGTGLGLSTVDGIVNQHGGSVEVESTPGRGTRFTVHLPLCANPHNESGAHKIRSPHRGSGRLLLVEDDAQVRGLALRILQLSGYQVKAAENGEAALNLISEQEKPFDVLVTDVVMPGMDGASLALQLRAKQPDLKVLFVSGYTDDRLAHFGVGSEDYNFLAKPYSPWKLCEKVQSILRHEGTSKAPSGLLTLPPGVERA